MPGLARSSWLPVLAYAGVSAANQMLWLTYTPITTDAARHYGVSDGAIGWLAEIFPLLYVALALPAGRLIDRNMPLWLGVGAVLTAVGGGVRLAGDNYLAVLAGQLCVAIAQPLVLNAVTSVSVAHLRPRDRPTGIAISSAGIFFGMVLALVLGATLGTGRLHALLLVQAAIGGATALVLCLALRSGGPFPAAEAAPGSIRQVWSDGYLRKLVGLVCLGFGVFIALTTWLQTLLEPASVSDSAAGYLLLGMVLGGVLGSVVVPPALARRGLELRFVLLSVLGTAGGLVVLAIAPGVATGAAVLAVVGVLLLTDLPLVLELAERRTRRSGGTASALIWLAGNAAGLVAALIVQELVHRPAAAFAVLAAMLLPGIPLLRSLRREERPEPRQLTVRSETAPT